MKTYQIKKLLKKDLLILELAPLEYYETFKDGIYIKDYESGERDFIEGSYTLLGKPDEISEDDARELVNLHESGYYKDYINGNNFFTLPSKSLLSAIETVVFWDVNPVKHPKDYSLAHQSLNWYTNQEKKFIEAEQKTFDRNRTLIFKKNK